MDGKWWCTVGAVLGLLAVAFGAFGAHALEGKLDGGDVDAVTQAKLLDTWDVGARYQMYHALALLSVGIVGGRRPTRILQAAGILFCLGVLIFSGGLYVYVLSGVRAWAMIVPVGGVAMISGWLLLAIGVARTAAVSRD
jgi:uncharacterized membrane protein YgdD (TMEM256/DUF423 family)